jgi:hypothetical protein
VWQQSRGSRKPPETRTAAERTFGDNYFVRWGVEAGASSGSSLRQEPQKTTPGGFEKKSINVPMPEATAKGAKREKAENVWFFRDIDYASSQH